MRPIPIPDEVARAALPLGWECKVIVGPDGDLTGNVRPVDALVGMVGSSDIPDSIHPELNVLIKIEEKDIPVLAKNGGLFWISFTGHIVPFGLTLFDMEALHTDGN